MGEVEAEVVDARRFDLHGVGYVDVAIRYPDGTTESARLGPEGAPENLQPGERVLATKVANMIVSIRRPLKG
jgi:hypothetical protein